MSSLRSYSLSKLFKKSHVKKSDAHNLSEMNVDAPEIVGTSCDSSNDFFLAALLVLEEFEAELDCSSFNNELSKKIKDYSLRLENLKKENIKVIPKQTDRSGILNCLIYLFGEAVSRCEKESESIKAKAKKESKIDNSVVDNQIYAELLQGCLAWVKKATKGKFILLRTDVAPHFSFAYDNLLQFFEFMNVLSGNNGALCKGVPLYFIFPSSITREDQLKWKVATINELFSHAIEKKLDCDKIPDFNLVELKKSTESLSKLLEQELGILKGQEINDIKSEIDALRTQISKAISLGYEYLKAQQEAQSNSPSSSPSSIRKPLL